MKPLIVYYSRRGPNLMDGKVQTLRVGNTEMMAAILQKLTDADCIRIEPYEDYPEDYYECINQARQDLIKGMRPGLKNCPASIDRDLKQACPGAHIASGLPVQGSRIKQELSAIADWVYDEQEGTG